MIAPIGRVPDGEQNWKTIAMNLADALATIADGMTLNEIMAVPGVTDEDAEFIQGMIIEAQDLITADDIEDGLYS